MRVFDFCFICVKDLFVALSLRTEPPPFTIPRIFKASKAAPVQLSSILSSCLFKLTFYFFTVICDTFVGFSSTVFITAPTANTRFSANWCSYASGHFFSCSTVKQFW